MITKIIDTVHTVGIDSFSMYEHFTRPSDGIPKQNAETRLESFSFNNLLSNNLMTQSKSGKLDDVKIITDYLVVFRQFLFSLSWLWPASDSEPTPAAAPLNPAFSDSKLRRSTDSSFPVLSAFLTWKKLLIFCCLGSTKSLFPLEVVFLSLDFALGTLTLKLCI